jgi:putative membrane protein
MKGKTDRSATRQIGKIAKETKKELAEDRTDWAQERTLLAKERTFSAWVRTGIASVAAGLATARLLGSVDHPEIARAIGVLLIFAGAIVFILGFMSYRKALHILADQDVRGTPLWIIALITLFLLAATALAFLLIFEE